MIYAALKDLFSAFWIFGQIAPIALCRENIAAKPRRWRRLQRRRKQMQQR
jgi:hypothetical protein